MTTFLVVAVGVLGCAGVLGAGLLGGSARPGRVAALVALGAAGALIGLMGSMVQGYTLRLGGSSSGLIQDSSAGTAPSGPGGFEFPLGALCALAVLAGVLYAGARAFRGPIGVCVPALTWLLAVGALTFGTSKGDVVLASTTAAEIYVYGGLVLGAVGLLLAYQWQLTDRLKPQNR